MFRKNWLRCRRRSSSSKIKSTSKRHLSSLERWSSNVLQRMKSTSNPRIKISNTRPNSGRNIRTTVRFAIRSSNLNRSWPTTTTPSSINPTSSNLSERSQRTRRSKKSCCAKLALALKSNYSRLKRN